MNKVEKFSLDDLYYMTASVYSEQNIQRTTNTTFTHFVEVCGMLTINCGHKKKENLTFEDAICKALGWFFPLVARFKIKSIQEVIFMKYPYACPYCRRIPHQDVDCKMLKGTLPTVDHEGLRKVHKENIGKMPSTLSEWQQMFQGIYPRSTQDRTRSAIGLLEELGELAEAIRVFELYPKYLIGEVADVFSYLMGFANEYNIECIRNGKAPFEFEKEFLKRFPGICSACGNSSCVCPAVPEATIGRMAKELDIPEGSALFLSGNNEIILKGREIGLEVFKYAGGFGKIFESLPLDRGEINKDLMIICLKIAEIIKQKHPEAASQLASAALKIAKFNNKPGTKVPKEDIKLLLDEISDLLKKYPEDKEDLIELIKSANKEKPSKMELLFTTKKVLLVINNPLDENPLNTSGEGKAIQEALRRSSGREYIDSQISLGTTKDNLRRELLDKEYDIVHFAGHGKPNGIVLADDNGNADVLSLDELRTILSNHNSISCVIFNSCFTISQLQEDNFEKYTIVGMEDSVDDNVAIEFSKGFYDALGAQKDINFCVAEGIKAAKINKQFDLNVKIIPPYVK